MWFVVLVIVLFVLWGLGALAMGIYEGLVGAKVSMSQVIEANRLRRFNARKDHLAKGVLYNLPNAISIAGLQRAEQEFQRRKAQPAWMPVRPSWQPRTFAKQTMSPQDPSCSEMDITDVGRILSPNSEPWIDKEAALISRDCSYPGVAPTTAILEFKEFVPPAPLHIEEAKFEFNPARVCESDIARYFSEERERAKCFNESRLQAIARHSALIVQIEKWNSEQRKSWNQYRNASAILIQEELEKFRRCAQQYNDDCRAQSDYFKAQQEGYSRGSKTSVVARTNWIMGSLSLPGSVPRQWQVDFDEEEGILIVEVCLPDIVNRPPMKLVQRREGMVATPLNQSERREHIPKVHPAILLRIGFEIARNDSANVIKLIVVNGWINFREPATGRERVAYTASLRATPDRFREMDIGNVDPLSAFDHLSGKSAGRLVEIVPIEPQLKLRNTDSRFVNARDVIDTLGRETNLAVMDWQDFEHLIRELFEKEFASRGAEVMVTRASRDRGVDAIAFIPDPIIPSKIVIQAKRYVNTVDVSAVRELFAVVQREGADRGILVTTSSFGADSWEFINNSPITLINGAELLGLLKKHGYGFRIDLTEARQALAQSGRE
jgi:restriction system protein